MDKKENWTERDELPTQDPIGDVDEYVEGYECWKKDMKAYFDQMKRRVIELRPDEEKLAMVMKNPISTISEPPTCNCGTFATYGKVPVDAHRPYCDLRKHQDSI